jgi:hypothetical protein
MEIKTFDEVILFHMQREQKTLLYFNEIWRICEKAAPLLPSAIHPATEPKRFVKEMLYWIGMLAEAHLILRHTKSDGQKLSHITITRDGLTMIDGVIFSNQQRMGI